MSSGEAQTLYEQVISDVIGDSRQDFEDSGIDEATLQDLKSIWQENLANARVTNLQWAPLTEPAPTSSLETKQDAHAKPEGGAVNVNLSTGAPIEFELKDENGQLTKTLQRQREAELKKERTLAALDSDDINSDLDDSDEDDQGFGDEDEDGDGMIILCLYEKVLRVKNKWKCNLKDGIANIHGRDYAFAKATGESEW
ncbi:Transcription initiation factor IIA large subunit [Cyberlindnera fabianii]|uniref:Transcription initiation factor IIA large subunit n=1 Tax=Cyberlindnera fabianii TaxID=36022 RepID=A0A1V2L6L3_CYBFA|nr:Transcription initiation factor IIA large subunit [Cyberlindnera fabianii]